MIYAVHKQTKEHRVVGPHSAILMRDYDIVPADADGWVEWRGEECPLPGNQLCEVKVAYCQQIAKDGAMPASRWHWPWARRGNGGDIIAYRPIFDEPQAAEDCVTVRYDLNSASVEGTIRDKLIEMGWTPPKDKPQAPEWNGKGLPPVGTVCEVYIANRDAWVETEVKTHADGLALFKNGTGGHYYGRTAEHYRPIRTEREKWIEAAGDIAEPEHETAEEFLEAIYDALKSGDLPQP